MFNFASLIVKTSVKTEVNSFYDDKFKYKIGETVKPEKEFDNTNGLCGSGIHGYIDFVDAVKY